MKGFNKMVFLLSVIPITVLAGLSLLAAFGQDEGTLPQGLFWQTSVELFSVFRFPLHTLFWPFIAAGGTILFFATLIINWLLYALLIERLIFWWRNAK